MSRGRRGGGGKRGPDLSWDDEESLATPIVSNRPEETFPPIDLPVPRPISSDEHIAIKRQIAFRSRARNGPYYAILDPSSVADEKSGKVLKRAGFDPFNDQEKYTAKYQKKKQAVPDLSTREYALHLFPHELWPLLDPRKKNPLWKTTDIDFDAETNAPRKNLKRKRDLVIDDAEDDDEAKGNDDGNDTDDSDPLMSGTRRSRNSTKAAKRRREDPTTKKAHEKRGLDAEDEFSDAEVTPRSPGRKSGKNRGGSDDEDDDDDDDEHNEDNSDGSGDEDDDDSGDDEPVDSEFEESDDGDYDDYNAEQYFDGGEGDDDDYGGGGDEDGGTF